MAKYLKINGKVCLDTWRGMLTSLSFFRPPLAAAGCRLFFLPPPANEAWGTPPRGVWNHDAKVRHFFRLCKFSGHFFSSNFKLKPILPETGCLMGVLDGRMTVLGRFFGQLLQLLQLLQLFCSLFLF